MSFEIAGLLEHRSEECTVWCFDMLGMKWHVFVCAVSVCADDTLDSIGHWHPIFFDPTLRGFRAGDFAERGSGTVLGGCEEE